MNPTWNELDRGVWSREKLLQSFIKEAPDLEQEIRLVFSDLSTIVRKFPKSDSWVQSLKAVSYTHLAVGLGVILYQGIGDTIRVSLTGDPAEEVK